MAAGGKLLQFGSGGAYEIIDSLGQGGMAEVFRARRVGPGGFERLVAVKRIRPQLGLDAGYRAAFLDEARLAARLQHRNIAQIFDLQEQDGTLFLVMELVHGDSLRTLLGRAQAAGGVSAGLACYVAIELLDALGYAHSLRDPSGHALGIVHRDVSPHNAMLSRSGEVKLLDFGVAFSHLEDRQATESGLIKGKFEYMSPEQAMGEKDLDARSDLFSLGIVLAEMLTGRRMFRDDSPTRTLLRISQVKPEEVAQATASLPADLKAILQQALARERQGRFQSAEAFSLALRAWTRSHGPPFGPSEAAAEIRPWIGEPSERSTVAFSPVPTRIESTVARRRWRRRLPWLGLAAIVLIAAALWRGEQQRRRSEIRAQAGAEAVQGRPDQECVKEALSHLAECADSPCERRQNEALSACLETSAATSGFCSGVPRWWQIGASEGWKGMRCSSAGFGEDRRCYRLLNAWKSECERRRSSGD